MKIPQDSQKGLIQNLRRRQTIKCQRKKNLIKKCLELSKLCNLKVNLIVSCPEANSYQQYSSHADFRLDHIAEFIEKGRNNSAKARGRNRKKVAVYANEPVKEGKKVEKTNKKRNFIEDLPLDLNIYTKEKESSIKKETI